jgi:hypothetical protein
MEILNQLRDRMADAKREMAVVGKEALAEEVHSLFAKWPELQSIRWAQYTPYFNDGDACVFGLGDVKVRVEEMDDDDEETYLYAYEFDSDRQERTLLMDFENLLEDNKDVMEYIFGDHCQVTFYRERNEAEIEEYEHD